MTKKLTFFPQMAQESIKSFNKTINERYFGKVAQGSVKINKIYECFARAIF